MANPYTPADAGCYVDGARGIYTVDLIVAIARDHGAIIDSCNPKECPHAETCDPSEFAGCEFSGEIEDEATEYMETHFPVDGHFWGRSEQGDWGLWPVED